MKFLKINKVCNLNIMGLVITGVLSIIGVGVQSASGTSLSFEPAGKQLDGDPIKDIPVTPGQQLTFNVAFNPMGAFIRFLIYNVDFDTNELKFNAVSAPGADVSNSNVNTGSLIITRQTTPDQINAFTDTFSFTVTNPTKAPMDGLRDFQIQNALTLAVVNGDVVDFRGSFTGDIGQFPYVQDVEVQTPIPEPPMQMQKDPDKPQLKDSGAKSVEFTETNTLNFSDLMVTDALLDNQIPSVNDPILGGNILIGSTDILGEDPGNGWFFTDSTYQVVVGGIPVLTADLVNNFLFAGGGSMPGFDSEFQGTFKNIQINNVINSPYLDTLQNQINSPRFVSVFSNIPAATNNLTTPGSSETVLMDGGKSVPEPSSTLSLLALGTLGAASTLKRKLKSSKSSEKETTNVS